MQDVITFFPLLKQWHRSLRLTLMSLISMQGTDLAWRRSVPSFAANFLRDCGQGSVSSAWLPSVSDKGGIPLLHQVALRARFSCSLLRQTSYSHQQWCEEKKWVKQLTISQFSQMFSMEMWTKQKVCISKNWLKLNHVIYSINKLFV